MSLLLDLVKGTEKWYCKLPRYKKAFKGDSQHIEFHSCEAQATENRLPITAHPAVFWVRYSFQVVFKHNPI